MRLAAAASAARCSALDRDWAAVLAASVAALATAASAADKTLKIQTSSNASHASLAYLNEEWVPKLETMTGGSLGVELLPIDAVVYATFWPTRTSSTTCESRHSRDPIRF